MQLRLAGRACLMHTLEGTYQSLNAVPELTQSTAHVDLSSALRLEQVIKAPAAERSSEGK